MRYNLIYCMQSGEFEGCTKSPNVALHDTPRCPPPPTSLRSATSPSTRGVEGVALGASKRGKDPGLMTSQLRAFPKRKER